MTDLAARRDALQQRFRDLTARAQQLEQALVQARAEALKVAGALEEVQRIMQEWERANDGAAMVTHTTGAAVAPDLGDPTIP